MIVRRALHPLGLLAGMADVLAGYGLVCCYYGFDPLNKPSLLAALVASGLCLKAARSLFDAVFALEERSDRTNAWSQRGRATKPFLLACLASGCGLLAAMSAGMPGFVCACVIAALGFLDGCCLVRVPLGLALSRGAGRTLNVLLGMSVYPLLGGAGPWPLLPALLAGLYCASVLLATPPRDKDTGRLTVFISASAGACVIAAAMYNLPDTPYVFWSLSAAWAVLGLAMLQGFFGRRGSPESAYGEFAESAVPLLECACLCGFATEQYPSAAPWIAGAFAVLFFFALADSGERVGSSMRV